MSQRAVCEAMGMAHSFLSKCETKERRIDVLEFLQLAELYRKPLQFFLFSGEVSIAQNQDQEEGRPHKKLE